MSDPIQIAPKVDDVLQKKPKEAKGHHLDEDEEPKPPPGFFQSDLFQKITMSINALVAIYSACMAALLAYFVPQLCCPQDYTAQQYIDGMPFCYNPTTQLKIAGPICSQQQNFDWSTDTPFNKFVVVINLVTLAMILAVFVIEYLREMFLIECFDIDPEKIDGHLRKNVFINGHYDTLKQRLHWHNQCYLWAYSVTSFVWLVNAVVSAVLVFRFYYLDSRTATSFITNNLLLVLRFIKGYGVASQSLSEEKAISFYTFKQTTFNVIDPDYRFAKFGIRNSISAAAGDTSLVTIAAFLPAAGMEAAVLPETGRSGGDSVPV